MLENFVVYSFIGNLNDQYKASTICNMYDTYCLLVGITPEITHAELVAQFCKEYDFSLSNGVVYKLLKE